MPAWVTSALAEAYRAKGIQELYSHQASTAELVRNGKNVVVVTPTASGKTLCYNLPTLNAVLENPDARALYLFPTKALAQDQLAELQDLAKRLDDSFGVFTYDGDTPSDARKAIRERGHIVLTNPDMLHSGILPHHTKWMRVFENLRYIVLDELHTYRGVFGSHLANDGALGRLLVIVENYPQLKSNENFLRLQDELAGTENRIAVERKRYNDNLQDYNTYVQQFPHNILAGWAGFKPNNAYFAASEGSRQVPKVDFSNPSTSAPQAAPQPAPAR